jgi:hypothetical protein
MYKKLQDCIGPSLRNQLVLNSKKIKTIIIMHIETYIFDFVGNNSRYGIIVKDEQAKIPYDANSYYGVKNYLYMV